MKERWLKIRKPLCGAVMALCLVFLLGCTGTAELGGDIGMYIAQGGAALAVMIAAGVAGKIFDERQ